MSEVLDRCGGGGGVGPECYKASTAMVERKQAKGAIDAVINE